MVFGKNITYILNDNTLQIQQNLDNETAMGFLAGYFYRKGKAKEVIEIFL